MNPRHEITVPPTREGIVTALDLLDNILAQAGIPENTCSEVHLAAEEAVVNILSYSHANNMTITADAAGNVISVTITDDGMPFDPLAVPPPDLDQPLDERVPGGLGIFLIRKSMDCVEYEYQGGQNVLRMVKRF